MLLQQGAEVQSNCSPLNRSIHIIDIYSSDLVCVFILHMDQICSELSQGEWLFRSCSLSELTVSHSHLSRTEF